ncbi:deoxyribonuclease V [Pleionea sp. CnH1-48]|uniref:deoxyribonuclease V n=1 Tax=Pleionea sp. CnH1-48 TaxID=2954494 RepID=UPI00209804C4|nr:deoxyribonuclease V [Pleionea sp. CnH1-48]MCO7225337.1 deoxyribonuclease V [Pleionea sp. CnH1-48]
MIKLYATHSKMIPDPSQLSGLSEEDALKMQHTLAQKIVQSDQFTSIKTIAGTDVAYEKDGQEIVSAVVVMDASTLDVLEVATARDKISFPYIPGLFSFREIPPLLKAFKSLQHVPDLIVCDGQGIAHPRRFGLASHLGVLLDRPTIGCGKTRLCGEHDDCDDERGDFAHLIDNDQIIGAALRTQKNVKPVYVSVGHRISLPTAIDWILKLTPRYRLPETTRKADQAVNAIMNNREIMFS